MNAGQQKVLDTIRTHGVVSNGDIHTRTDYSLGYNTIRRITQELRAMGAIEETGERNIMREKTFRVVMVVANETPVSQPATV